MSLLPESTRKSQRVFHRTRISPRGLVYFKYYCFLDFRLFPFMINLFTFLFQVKIQCLRFHLIFLFIAVIINPWCPRYQHSLNISHCPRIHHSPLFYPLLPSPLCRLYKKYCESAMLWSRVEGGNITKKMITTVFDLISVLFAYVILGQKNRPNI